MEEVQTLPVENSNHQSIPRANNITRQSIIKLFNICLVLFVSPENKSYWSVNSGKEMFLSNCNFFFLRNFDYQYLFQRYL